MKKADIGVALYLLAAIVMLIAILIVIALIILSSFVNLGSSATDRLTEPPPKNGSINTFISNGK